MKQDYMSTLDNGLFFFSLSFYFYPNLVGLFYGMSTSVELPNPDVSFSKQLFLFNNNNNNNNL